MSISTATGIISRVHPDQEVYDVDLDQGGTLRDCMSCAGGIFAPLFGFNVSMRIPLGTKVAVIGQSPGLILGCLRSQTGDPSSAASASATTAPTDIREMTDGEVTASAVPVRPHRDMLEGEFALTNVYRVGVMLLTHFAKLQAGDRAKVECFLLDDLVRIVSDSFHHMSSFGDYKIINDGGKITVRWDGTSHEHEAWGLLQARAPKAPTAVDGVVDDQEVQETGRWRFAEFVGHLGDFIHMFVTDPCETLGSLAQERAGKFHAHVNNDGSLLVQSVGDIVFERVTRILVPTEQKAYDHPEGNTADEEPSSDFLDTWRFDPNKPWESAYHLRDYARWLNSYHAYARFLQQDKDWVVSSEAEAKAPMYSAGEKERERAVPGILREPRVTYSCIRIMRDGSQILLDGYGGSIMQAGGVTTISSPLDIRMEAGRNIMMLAGQDVFVKARRHLELTAVVGSFLAKARTRVAVWAEQGTILMRTLMTPGERGDPEAHRFQQDKVGIVIDAPHSRVLVSAGQQVTVESKGEELEAEEGGVEIQSVGEVHVRAGQDKAVRLSGKDVVLKAEHILLKATAWICLAARDIDFGKLLLKKGGELFARVLKVETLLGKTIIHGKEMIRGHRKHTNHVIYSASAAGISMPDGPDENSVQPGRLRAMNDGAERVKRTKPVCEYLPRTDYPEEPVLQSLTQQISATADHPAGLEFEQWDFSEDDANGDDDAAHTHPYPGKGAQMTAFPSTALLHKPSEQAPSEFTPTPSAPPERKPAVFHRYKP